VFRVARSTGGPEGSTEPVYLWARSGYLALVAVAQHDGYRAGLADKKSRAASKSIDAAIARAKRDPAVRQRMLMELGIDPEAWDER
jgi:hypothetical protein